MQFKDIEMTGFKSFVETTHITFGSGITAIVGPNGCGKSNISDAIRWVLGEQSAKMLRGAKMEDFIFNGSANRKPGGMAEVTITLKDIAGLIQKPELSEYNEIAVTRRLYRSGESEYLINKVKCRLKDVVDLFLDTGLSTRAFSIMEQDQIQRIVTSKPENRRFIVEEAAGIMKYKNRRHAALNKLESATQNLERVSDIISELERQANSLKRQSSKAERFKKYRTEATNLFMAVSADEWKNLKEIEISTATELEEQEVKRVSMEADISTRQNHLITLQASIDEQAQNMATQKEADYQLTSLIESNEGKIGLFGDQITDGAQEIERLNTELVELDKRMEGMHSELETKKEEIAELDGRTGSKASELETKKEEMAKAGSEIETVATEIGQNEREQVEVATLLSESGNRLASARTRYEMLEKKHTGIEGEEEEAQKAIESVKAKIEQKETSVRSKEEGYNALQTTRAELDSKHNNIVWVKGEKERGISETRTSIAEKRARLESLQELESSNAGYQEGVKSLLELKEKNHQIASILHGTLIDHIKTDPAFEKGIEVVLGEKLQAVLIRDSRDAINAINLLRDKEMGRGTFLPMERSEQTDLPEIPSDEDVIGRASDLVHTDGEYAPLLQRLLRDVVFVNDIDAALRLSANSNLTFVTQRGDVIDRFGVISGGSTEKTGGGLLERKRMIGELTTGLKEDEHNLELLNSEMESNSSILIELENEIVEKERLLKEAELGSIHEKKDLETLSSELERHHARMETYTAELEALEIERDNLQQGISEQEKSLEQMQSRKESLAGGLESLHERQKLGRENYAKINEAVSSAEVELTSLKGETAVADADRQRLVNSLTELSERLEAIKNGIESNFGKKKKLEEEINELQEEIHNSLEKRDRLSTLIKDIGEKLEEARENISGQEKELKNRQAELDQLKEALNETKIRKSENSIRLTTLLERAEEQEITRMDIENFDPGEMNIEECRERLAELKEKLSKIGDVNLSAIEDYNQVMERLTFLKTQHDDLMESITDIRKVIEKLNRTTKKLFEDTFNQIRENFKKVFTKLFKGGEADMFLSDENNMLESGIDIFVRPPGKRKQNITLLSAGEKAMTAISILFAVFMVKPSPFCLLDEVDAPLDEANIVRFKDILREFSKVTQFLVITHNQKTMAFSDRLYGITMQDPGISSVLSVDLIDNEEPQERRLKVVGG